MGKVIYDVSMSFNQWKNWHSNRSILSVSRVVGIAHSPQITSAFGQHRSSWRRPC
jgi:hypothetical protein